MDIPMLKPTGSISLHILLVLLQVMALVAPRFQGRQAIFGTALVSLFLISRIKPHFSNDLGKVQPFVLNWAAWLSVLTKTITTGAAGPEAHFWRIDRPAREAMGMQAFSPTKIRWAIAMLLNMRGIRWNYEVKNLQHSQAELKSVFLLKQLRYLLYLLFMGDMASEIWRHFMFSPGIDPKYLTVRSPSLVYRFAWTWLCGLLPYYLIQIQYVVCAIISVLIGLSVPEVRFHCRIKQILY